MTRITPFTISSTLILKLSQKNKFLVCFACNSLETPIDVSDLACLNIFRITILQTYH